VGRRRPPQPRPPSLVQQLANLRRLHPTLEGRIEGGMIIAIGWLRGGNLTRRYRVRVEYRPGRYPRVLVLEPPLERRHPDQPVAHTNGPSEPCLFTIANGDWGSGMYLGQTIVPWLLEWLVFYELWRGTGRWFGGGTLPDGYDDLTESPDNSAA